MDDESKPGVVAPEAETEPEQQAELEKAKGKIDLLREEVEAAITLRVRQIRKRAEREFKEWKRTLMEMIRTGSTLQFNERTGDYQFILPARLVKLVWSTTVKERVKLEKVKGAEDATKQALVTIRDEVDEAVKGVMARAEAQRAEVVDINAAKEESDAQPAAQPVDGQGDAER